MLDQWDHIRQDSPAAAERFLLAVAEAEIGLAEFPGKGAAIGELRSRGDQLRRWSPAGFRNHLIVYRFDANLLEIVRILHGASDFDRALGGP